MKRKPPKRLRDELDGHCEFFESWYGKLWEPKVRIRLGLHRRHIQRFIYGDLPLSDEQLKCIRTHRTLLESFAAAHA